jgi:hypothetical protein
MSWKTGTPPNETLVEVEHCGEIIQVMAFYGRDGNRPHWRTQDGSQCWDVTAFRKWREIAK